jgi:hypothetical protein
MQQANKKGQVKVCDLYFLNNGNRLVSVCEVTQVKRYLDQHYAGQWGNKPQYIGKSRPYYLAVTESQD